MLGVDPTKADDDFKITRFWMEGGKPMFEFNHSADGAGKSFVPKPSLFSLYPLLFTKFKMATLSHWQHFTMSLSNED